MSSSAYVTVYSVGRIRVHQVDTNGEVGGRFVTMMQNRANRADNARIYSLQTDLLQTVRTIIKLSYLFLITCRINRFDEHGGYLSVPIRTLTEQDNVLCYMITQEN